MPINNKKMFYVPLEIENQHLAVDGEIMIDYDKALVYLRMNNKTVQLGAYEIDKAIQERIDELLDGATLQGNNLYKLENRLNKIIDWKERQMTTDMDLAINTFLELIELFKGFPADGETLKSILNNKISKKDGYILSSNNFTVEEYNKLQNISTNANLYKHPKTKACKYYDPVESVNGKTGIVTITKDDVGLENLDINANDYVHPINKVCNTKIVTSLNNKVGDVIITKKDVGMSNLNNLPLKGLDEINPDENAYFNTKNLNLFIEDYIINYINKYEILDKRVVLRSSDLTPKGMLENLYSLHYIYRNPVLNEDSVRHIYQTNKPNDLLYVNPLSMDKYIEWTKFTIGKQICYLANDIILNRCIPRMFVSELFALEYYKIEDEYYILTVPDRDIYKLFDIDRSHFKSPNAYNILLQNTFDQKIFEKSNIIGMDINNNIKQGSFYNKLDTVFLGWRPMLKQMNLR